MSQPPRPGVAKAGALDADFYDRGFQLHRAYALPWQRSPYLPLWQRVLAILLAHETTAVLDIGCGPGQFATFVRDHAPELGYRGFDFNQVAVTMARERGLGRSVSLGDLRESEPYEGKYDAATCIEVLEHLDDDLAVFSRLPVGALFVFTVPSYDSDGHVRFFPSAASVRERYRSRLADFTLSDLVLRKNRRHVWIGTGRLLQHSL